jgi:hypothetical protein
MLTAGVVAYLNAQASIAEVVGDRIQPIPAPDDILAFCPGITYQSPSDVSENANDGPVGIAASRIVFDCLASRALDARNLALAVKATLNGFGPAALPDGTYVESAESVSIADRFDDGSRIYCTSVHVLFRYRDY